MHTRWFTPVTSSPHVMVRHMLFTPQQHVLHTSSRVYGAPRGGHTMLLFTHPISMWFTPRDATPRDAHPLVQRRLFRPRAHTRLFTPACSQVRRVEAADEARCEQLLPMAAELGAELAAHPEFAGGLVSALMADPARRLTPQIARVAVSRCLLPLSAVLPHAHRQLRRLLHAQWQALHAMPAEGATGEVSSILAARGVGEGTLISTMLSGSALEGANGAAAAGGGGGGGGSEGVLSLLQYAARTANEKGATEAGDEEKTEKSYQKLSRLVPGLMGGRGRIVEE
jgi:hypothetical protein